MNLRDPDKYLAALCRDYWFRGWFAGTSGAVSYRQEPENIPGISNHYQSIPGKQLDERIYMTPTGRSKRDLAPQDLVVLDMDGNPVLGLDGKPIRNGEPSSNAPLLLEFHRHGYNGVIHVHTPGLVIFTRNCGDKSEITGIENQKGIQGYSNDDIIVIPVLENVPNEPDLLPDIRRFLEDVKTGNVRDPFGILVRNHGLYAYGEDF